MKDKIAAYYIFYSFFLKIVVCYYSESIDKPLWLKVYLINMGTWCSSPEVIKLGKLFKKEQLKEWNFSEDARVANLCIDK